MKLKTLKDIELPSDGCDCENRIKQEAIKCVKFLIKQDAQTYRFREFFNITEEDLK